MIESGDGAQAPAAVATTYAGRWVSATLGAQGLRTDVLARTHAFPADEPVSLGGADAGPTPFELLLAALGSCMTMTMRLYADRKGWPLDGARVQLRTAPSRDPDPEVRMVGAKRVTHIEQRIEVTGALTEEQRARLIEIADRCPVKRALEGGIQVVTASGEAT